MLASVTSFAGSSPTDMHSSFLTLLLPKVATHARISFRHLGCAAANQEAIQECQCLAWKWHVRLCERGKDATGFPMVFAYLVVRAVTCGRRVCGQERTSDVLSPRAQRRHGFTVEPLPSSTRASEDLYRKPHGQEMHDVLEERLHDNTITPPPDAAAFRIDFPRFFASLSTRNRRLAAFLALGHSATSAAAEFGVSSARVTQLRQRWCRAWHAFEGGASPERRRRQVTEPIAA
jgi:hypothetical protein